jgi:flagellar hook-basal body complex protein FliE
MAAPIQGNFSLPSLDEVRGAQKGGSAGRAEKTEGDFGDALTDALSAASEGERTANDAAARFASGDPTAGIHETMIAAEKASISLRYAVTLKNKAIEAYRELMNTPV